MAIPIPRIIFRIKLSANLIARCRSNLKPCPSLITDGRDSKTESGNRKVCSRITRETLRMPRTPRSPAEARNADDLLPKLGREGGSETPRSTRKKCDLTINFFFSLSSAFRTFFFSAPDSSLRELATVCISPRQVSPSAGDIREIVFEINNSDGRTRVSAKSARCSIVGIGETAPNGTLWVAQHADTITRNTPTT